MSEPPLRIESFRGQALHPYLPALSALRITVFRDYPYLYDGDTAKEEPYLARYAQRTSATAAIAFDNDTPVGAATCLSLAEETDAIRAPLVQAGFDPAHTWYFGESVLLPQYRGRGIGVAFFHAREEAALSDPACTRTVFCSVERPADHPARPADYVPLDTFWRNRGYAPHPDLACILSWKEVGQTTEEPHRLLFWSRTLRPRT